MRLLFSFLLILLLTSCAVGKERSFTGSTPVGSPVRAFLGIPANDSLDFIRWWLTIDDKNYTLECNYGIGKPNTSGFMNGGKIIKLSGDLKKEQHYFYLLSGVRSLAVLELNDNLLHLLSNDKTLLVGTGGWSYTLCNEKAVNSESINFNSREIVFKDSIAYQGRTPCPGLDPRHECLKLKWSLVLFANPKNNKPASYRMKGTISSHENRTGVCNIIHGKDGRIIYQLNNANGNNPLYLICPGENILLFTDASGNPLAGNKDFSYTLNRYR